MNILNPDPSLDQPKNKKCYIFFLSVTPSSCGVGRIYEDIISNYWAITWTNSIFCFILSKFHLFLVSCLFTSNDPGRVSQDVSGSGCGPAAGWFSSLSRFRRSPPYSLCGFCTHFKTAHCFRSFLCLLGPCSSLPLLCMRRNFSFSCLFVSGLKGLPHFWLSWWKLAFSLKWSHLIPGPGPPYQIISGFCICTITVEKIP